MWAEGRITLLKSSCFAYSLTLVMQMSTNSFLVWVLGAEPPTQILHEWKLSRLHLNEWIFLKSSSP